MRQLLVLTAVFFIVPLSFFAPFLGLISYIWIAYVRPHEWAYMPRTQLSLLVALATLAGYLIFELTRRAPRLTHNALLLLLWIQLVMATMFAQSPASAQGRLIEFSKTFLIALLVTAMIDSERRMRWLLLGLVFSIGFLAFRSNLGILLALGQTRIYGPGGAFEDNNDYALLLNVAAPLAFFVARGETDRRLKILCYSLSIMMMITVIFTLSRGGFLGLCVIAVAMALKTRWKAIAVAAVLTAGILVFLIVPDRVTERVGTISSATSMDESADESARMRLQTWKVCIQIIADHPLFGVGPGNILQVYGRYLDTANIRVAHNSFLQMGVDAGLPGMTLFLAMLMLSYRRLRKSRRILQVHAPESHLIAYTHGMEIALIGFVVSGSFLSRNDLELIYQVIAMATAMHLLAHGFELQSALSQGDRDQGFTQRGDRMKLTI